MKNSVLFLSVLVAGNVVLANPFEGVTETRPACFTRTYSDTHLKDHKLQTVKTMDVKLSRNDNDNLNLIEVKVLRTDGKRYKTALACDEKGFCFIDCDGGSAKITKAGQGLQLLNNGFIMQGGCGEEEETIYLESKPGGDDVFFLNSTQCK